MEIKQNESAISDDLRVYNNTPKSVKQFVTKFGNYIRYGMDISFNFHNEQRIGKIIGFDLETNTFKVCLNYKDSEIKLNYFNGIPLPEDGFVITIDCKEVIPILNPIRSITKFINHNGAIINPIYYILESMNIIERHQNFDNLPYERTDVVFHYFHDKMKYNMVDVVVPAKGFRMNICFDGYDKFRFVSVPKETPHYKLEVIPYSEWTKINSILDMFQIDYLNIIDNYGAINKLNIKQ